jgi:hypothetical protein
MKKKTVLILLSLSAIFALSSCKISNPLIGVGPVSGPRPVSLGVEGTLVGKTVGVGVWVEGDK